MCHSMQWPVTDQTRMTELFTPSTTCRLLWKGVHMDSEQIADIDLKHYMRVLGRWLWLIVLIAAIAAGGAYLVSRQATPIYEASTTLLISEGEQVSGPNYDSIMASQQLARTYCVMLTNTPVLDEVVNRLGLTISERQLAKMIGVEEVSGTPLIEVRVRSHDPELAAGIATMVPLVFIEQQRKAGSAHHASAMAGLDREMQQLQLQVQAAQQELDAERSRLRPDSTKVARLEMLVAQYRSTYADLLRSYDELRVAEAMGSSSITITKPAKAPTLPILPRVGLNTLLAAVAGLALAACTVLLLDDQDDLIRDETDVWAVAGLQALASIPRGAQAGLGKGMPPVTACPESAIAEAYRLLRANLQFALPDMGQRATAIVVSSADAQEGKTTTAANLGASLAQIGRRVLLVDANLRRPTLHAQFGLGNEAGLTSLLLQQVPDPQSIIQETGVQGLRVLTAGPVAGNPAELLEYPHLADVLAHLRGLANYLIIDSPALLRVADACILAQKADGVLLVVQQGKTRREALKNSVLCLQTVKARLLGIVLNRAGR